MSAPLTKFGDVVHRLSAVTSNAKREAWWLLSHCTGLSEHHLIQNATSARSPVPEAELELAKLLKPSQAEHFERTLFERIEERKPLQYILGDVQFCNLKLRARPPILIPRPETEEMSVWLVSHIRSLEAARVSASPLPPTPEPDARLRGHPVRKFRHSAYDSILTPAALAKNALHSPAFNALDLCTGSGNIALTLATQFPLANVLGADKDERAVKLARENGTLNAALNAYFSHCDAFVDRRVPRASDAMAVGTDEPKLSPAAPLGLLELSVHTHNKNFFTSSPSTQASPEGERQSEKSALFDVIISNPPYVTAAEYEGLAPEIRLWENKDALVPALPPGYQGQVAAHASSLSASVHWPTAAEVAAGGLAVYERLIWCAPRLLRPINEIWLRNPPSTPLPTFTHSANSPAGVANPAAAEAAGPRLNSKAEAAVLAAVPRLVLELGTEGQALAVADMMQAQGLRPEVFLDGGEKVRWVVGFHRQ